MPKDFEKQGKIMAQRCAYLLRGNNISKELVVNIFQICIHLSSIWKSRTWETKRTKHNKVHGTEDKRQVIVIVFSTTHRHCLSFKVIFKGITTKTLHKLEGIKKKYESSRWNNSYSDNHWSTLESYEVFVRKILRPYLDAQS